MGSAQFDARDYHEAQWCLANNPLALQGRHLAQLALVGELPHARAAVKYARRIEADQRREEAQRRARDLLAIKFARQYGRIVAVRDRAV